MARDRASFSRGGAKDRLRVVSISKGWGYLYFDRVATVINITGLERDSKASIASIMVPYVQIVIGRRLRFIRWHVVIVAHRVFYAKVFGHGGGHCQG